MWGSFAYSGVLYGGTLVLYEAGPGPHAPCCTRKEESHRSRKKTRTY